MGKNRRRGGRGYGRRGTRYHNRKRISRYILIPRGGIRL